MKTAHEIEVDYFSAIFVSAGTLLGSKNGQIFCLVVYRTIVCFVMYLNSGQHHTVTQAKDNQAKYFIEFVRMECQFCEFFMFKFTNL